ncbi:Flap endonuclease 1-A [Stylophora pistillata]|uniref:Flap endonuclease 1-A n=1 Tax=Stylophora pistillata TaxID=50429 RepID=A0A2B4R7V8_STYPI|nr:Flap endonuclease 1-A [Stylophora pistillata]
MNLFDDVNDKLFAFEQLYNDILKEHAPLKQTIVRGKHVPYMNEQWRKAIRHRNKLWRKFTKDRTDTNYEQNKIHRNKCTSLRRKAIKEHFLKKSTSSENPREFWNAYRLFLHGKTKQANNIILEENNALITEKNAVAELFNNHFIQVANSVARINDNNYGQDLENHPSILAIHEHYRDFNTPLSFDFHCTNSVQVEKLIKEVNVSKSSGHDMIPPRVIKASAAVIAEPIAHMFNGSIAQGCYASVWKMGQVTPLFMKGDEFKKENYRPVTVLPVLNNIYEKLLIAQLADLSSDSVGFHQLLQKLMVKTSTSGDGECFVLSHVLESLKPSMNEFRKVCIAAGCHYLKTVRGIGIQRAFKMVALSIVTSNGNSGTSQQNATSELESDDVKQQAMPHGTMQCQIIHIDRFSSFKWEIPGFHVLKLEFVRVLFKLALKSQMVLSKKKRQPIFRNGISFALLIVA